MEDVLYFNRYEEMFRLVETFHPTHLMHSYNHLATTLSAKNSKAAEIYFLKVGAFDKALNMYIDNGMWEDALRVRGLSIRLVTLVTIIWYSI